MNKSIPFVFALFMLIGMIACSACVSQPADQNTQGKSMLAQIAPTDESSHISFEDAKASLMDFRSHAMNTSANPDSVYYMRSRDLDASGNASAWVFGVDNGREAMFLIYDSTGWTTIPDVTLPDEEFTLDSIVSPALVFKQNTDAILGTSTPAFPVRRDIELQRGMYKLTITSDNSSRSLTFNATTGMLITER